MIFVPGKKVKKIHTIGGSEMIAIPKEWGNYYKTSGKKMDEVIMYVNSLLVVVPTNAKNRKYLEERARKIVEGKEVK